MMLTLLVVVLLAVALLPSALNIPQSNPNTVPEYAPTPPDEDSQTSDEGNLAALGQAGGSSLSRSGGVQTLSEVPSAEARKRSGKRCVGNPPRQTEDPMSPPCVAFFEGNNGGSTTRGVTRDEIRVIAYFDPASYSNGQGGGESTQFGYCDVDLPPNTGGGACFRQGAQADHVIVRLIRALSRSFNDRFQTYNRHVHFWVYFSDCGGGGETCNGARRRAEAADNYAKIKPFAVMGTIFTGYLDEYLDAMAQRGVMAYSTFTGDRPPAAAFQKNAPLLWSFDPDAEHWAEMYVDYVCSKVKPYLVQHATGGVRLGGGPMNNTERHYGLMYTSDAAYPGLQYFAGLVKNKLKADCNLVAAEEVRFPVAGYSLNADATRTDDDVYTQNIAKLRAADVTTVLWLGGQESKTGHAADAVKYYPEVMIAGDGVIDGHFTNVAQNPNWFRNAWLVSNQVREGAPDEEPYYQACREGNPQAPRGECVVARPHYRKLFMLFQGIQVAGARLSSKTVDQGSHAVPRIHSTDPSKAACFYDSGDFSCVKDSLEQWWDQSGQHPAPNPQSGPGCWRMRRGGYRYLPRQWPAGDDVFTDRADPCNGYDFIFQGRFDF